MPSGDPVYPNALEPLWKFLKPLRPADLRSLTLVGGPIRDLWLGRPCHDWDLAVDSPRHALAIARRLARAHRSKVITLDEDRRMYRVVVKGPPLRHGESSTIADGRLGRPPSETPPSRGKGEGAGDLWIDLSAYRARTLKGDLAKRDFTINALALPLISPHLDGGGVRPERHTVRRLHTTGAPPCRAAGGSDPGVEVRGIVDHFGGLRDLQRKIIRMISPQAFEDDPLRLLRAFRFAAELNFSIEPRTLAAIRSKAELISRTAPERIREELLRLLAQPHGAPLVETMDRVRLYTRIIPEVEAGRSVAVGYYGKGGVLKHHLRSLAALEYLIAHLQEVLPTFADRLAPYLREKVGGYPREAHLKLAILLHDVGKPSTAKVIKGRLRFFEHEDVGYRISRKLTRRMRFSDHESHWIATLVQNHMRPGNLAAAPVLTDKAIFRFFRDLGNNALGMLILSLADHFTYIPKGDWGKNRDPVERTVKEMLDRYYHRPQRIVPPRIINGHVLMRHLKLKPGPLIGKLLSAIQDAQAEGKIHNREEAIEYAALHLL